MPRGVYDRSKMKSKKTEGAPASAKKTWSRKAKSTATTGHTASSAHVQGDTSTLADLRQHLAILTNSRQQLAGNQALTQKIDAQITKTVEAIGTSFDSVFPERHEEHEEEIASSPRNAQAPVPFNPPGFAAPQPQQ